MDKSRWPLLMFLLDKIQQWICWPSVWICSATGWWTWARSCPTPATTSSAPGTTRATSAVSGAVIIRRWQFIVVCLALNSFHSLFCFLCPLLAIQIVAVWTNTVFTTKYLCQQHGSRSKFKYPTLLWPDANLTVLYSDCLNHGYSFWLLHLAGFKQLLVVIVLFIPG